MPENQSEGKKSFYKRWWFIVLAAIVGISVIANDENDESDQDETEVIAEENGVNNIVEYENDLNNSEEKENNNQNNEVSNNNSAPSNDKNEIIAEPQNCTDFSDGEEVYSFWTENGYHSENDPLKLDGDNSGVPCVALTSEMEDMFLEYEQEINPIAELPEYDIVEEEDVSIGDVIRLNYRIYPETGEATTEEEMVIITEDFIENLKQEKDFNGVSIYFSSHRDEDSGYSIGMVQYYPNGVIGDAMDYTAGDYSDHEFEYKYGGIN